MGKVTHLKQPCDDILEQGKGKFDDVMVVGWLMDEGGIELSSNMKNADLILMMELVKATIIEAHYGD